jgi:hypothetical protein
MMLATLKESIRVPAQIIFLLHPWQDPVPFRRVWCLFELYIATTLCANAIRKPHPQAKVALPGRGRRGLLLVVGFYMKPRKEEDDVESTPKRNTRRLKTDVEAVALIPTIDANQAQATRLRATARAHLLEDHG